MQLKGPINLLLNGMIGLVLGSFFAPAWGSCPSAENFTQTLELTSQEPWRGLPLSERFALAKEVTKGCYGAFGRFKKVTSLLETSGVDLKACLKSAVQFAQLSDDQTDSFLETFQKIFLQEYLNFDFESAFNLSREFARAQPKASRLMREDFLELVKFCRAEQGLSLPLKVCADHALTISRLQEKATDRIFPDWRQCYDFLRQDKRLGLDIQKTLTALHEILKGGPGSCSNFMDSFHYLTNRKKLELDTRVAFEMAKKIAQTSKSELPQPLNRE